MAKNQNVRLKPAQLQADKDALTAIQGFSDYNPVNSAYSVLNLTNMQNEMLSTQQAEVTAQAALNSARDLAAEAEWQFHNYILDLKNQVIAQYGVNSNQVQALGLKKKSEYKTPVRKKKSAA